MKLCLCESSARRSAILLIVALFFGMIPALARSQTTRPAASSAEVREFNDMDLQLSESALEQTIAQRNLHYLLTRDSIRQTYRIYRSDGENLAIVFINQKCVSVTRKEKDPLFADKLFNGLEKAAKSLQITLHETKPLWFTGDTLSLTADLRNTGPDDVAVFIGGYDQWQIELDGTWYRPSSGSTAHAVMLAPGEVVESIHIPPDWIGDRWHAATGDDLPLEGGESMKLTPGKHTVRVRVQLVLDNGLDGIQPAVTNTGKTMRLVFGLRPGIVKPEWVMSNPIEINVAGPSASQP